MIIYFFITENLLNRFYSVIPADELGIGWLRYVFLLNGFLNSDTYFWSNLGITWTIPIFLFFYLTAPFILRKVNSVRSSILAWLFVYVISRILSRFYHCTVFDNVHVLYLGAIIFACVNQKKQLYAILGFSCAAICMSLQYQTTYLYTCIFACLMLVLSALEPLNLPDRLCRMIDTLDRYSYTIYLAHGVVFCSVLDRLNGIGTPKILIALVAIVGTALGSWIVGKYIEKPIQRQLKKRLIK